MQVDWIVVAAITGPLLAAALGAWLTRVVENRPRLVTFYGHSAAVRLRPTATQPHLTVHTHSVVVRNVGRKTARNVRLGHATLPDFSIAPSTDHVVIELPDRSKEIRMPSLVPREQVTVHYLYFPPLLWADTNTYVKSDEGLAKVLTVLPTPQAPAWQRRIALILLLVGVITIIYLGLAAIG